VKFYARPSQGLPSSLFIWFLILGLSTIGASQSIANYAVTRTTGISYSSIISSGTPCNSWRYNGGFQQDDNRSNPVEIGFDFWYNGVRYTDVSISTNGYIDFSSSNNNGGPTVNPYGYANGQYTLPGGTLNSIAPIYDDQTTQGAVDPLGNSIRTKLTGTAPNRIFTIEWENMAIYLNTSPDLNYQVKIHETTGVIDFIYGTMINGTANFSYTSGLNGPVMNATPTTAQLKCQQTANTTTFSNTPVNNLSVLPASNSMVSFASPTPTGTASALTFTAIQAAQMTLNWTNWCTNEVGYVIYSSTDNVNFEFEAQTAANATSAIITGLSSSTTYYWRVYAVTEGYLSTPATGIQATLAGQEYRSFQTGIWSQINTWERFNGSIWVAASTIPTISDNVTITSTHTVTINTNAACHNLRVGQGNACVLQIGNDATVRTITIEGNVVIASPASFVANTASNTTHAMNCYRSITNSGTFNMAADANSLCNISFLHPYVTQNITGTGAIFNFNRITVNKLGGQAKLVDVGSSSFTATPGFLNLVRGTFRLSALGAVNVIPFNANATIPYNSRLWMNSNSSVMTCNGSVSLFGDLRVSGGNLIIGTLADQGLSSNGGLFTISAGTVTIAGRYDRPNTTAISRFNMSGGTVIVSAVGSTSNTLSPFMMDVPGSQFIQSSGFIIVRREGGLGPDNLGYNCSGANINFVTGGTLQIGDASTPVGQTMQINTIAPVGNLQVSSANATAFLINNPLTVIRNVLIQAGVFNANNLNVSLGVSWLNSGGTYIPGTNTTTFNSIASGQNITRTAGAETFNHLLFTGVGIKLAGSNFNCNNLTINPGATLDANTPGFIISLRGNWVNGGTFIPGSGGTVVCNGTVAQTIGGAVITNFRHLTINNTAGVSISTHEKLLGGLTLSQGVFTTTGFNFTLVSDSAGTAYIAPITAGNITGDIIMQRWQPSGGARWHQYACPVTGNTLHTGWNDDFYTSGFPGSDFPNYNFISIATYNEPVAGVKENGYVYPANISDPLLNTKGYFLYDFPGAFEVKGPPVKFTHNLPVTYTPSAGPTQDGWNMLPNPYPCALDWDAPTGWTRTNIDGVVYVYNSIIKQYTTYVGGIGTNGGSRYIPSSQAFWVRTIAASPVVTVTEPAKGIPQGNFLRTQSVNPYLLSLTLHKGTNTDQTIVRFDPAATTQFDVGYDAMKLASQDPSMPYFASAMDTVNVFSINTLASLQSDITVPLHVKAGTTGTHSITRDSISDFPKSVCIILEDLANGNITPLTAGASYTFFLADTSMQANRFLLHFSPAIESGQVAPLCVNSSDGKAFAHGIGNGPWNYTWKDANGNTIATHNAVTGTDTLFGIPAGIYTVDVDGNGGYCDTRTDTIDVIGATALLVNSVITQPLCHYTTDGAIYLNGIIGGQSPYQLLWPNSSSADSLINITAGNYDLLITDANNCPDTIHFSVNSLSTLSASFTANPDTVFVQNSVSFFNYTINGLNYTWDFGDTSALSNNPNPLHPYDYPNNYTVVLIADDGICYDTATLVVTVLADPSGVSAYQVDETVSIVPSESSLTLYFNLPSAQEVLVSVYDLSGKRIAQEQDRIISNRMDISLPVAESVYTVVIEMESGKRIVQKVVMVK
jgi:PKD domain